MKTFLFLLALAMPTFAQIDYQAVAVRKYPDLGNPESALNKKFLSLVAKRRKAEPRFFDNADWPVRIANDAAAEQVREGQAADEAATEKRMAAQRASDEGVRKALPQVGRFGETPEQCRVRYGAPVRENQSEARYEKNGFIIEVTFFEGRSDKLRYTKPGGGIFDSSDHFTRIEVDALLGNVSAGPWMSVANLAHDWLSPEGHRATQHTFVVHDLEIESARLVQQETARDAAKVAAEKKEQLQRAKGL